MDVSMETCGLSHNKSINAMHWFCSSSWCEINSSQRRDRLCTYVRKWDTVKKFWGTTQFSVISSVVKMSTMGFPKVISADLNLVVEQFMHLLLYKKGTFPRGKVNHAAARCWKLPFTVCALLCNPELIFQRMNTFQIYWYLVLLNPMNQFLTL